MLEDYGIETPDGHLQVSPGQLKKTTLNCYLKHWGIENRLHHLLDTALEEDARCIRRNSGVFALIRHFALNLLCFNGKSNIKSALYDNALSLDRLLGITRNLKALLQPWVQDRLRHRSPHAHPGPSRLGLR